MQIEDDLLIILKEFRKTSNSKFTGTIVLTVNMRNGGIAQMSLNLERNLKKQSKN